MVAYPAGLIKMGTIKSVLYNASLLLPQRGMFADVPFLETWATRLDASAVALILLGIAVFLWFRFSDLACKRHCIPFVIYGMLMLAVILRVKALPLRYMLPFVSALYPFTAIVLGSFLVRLRTPVRAAVLVLVCGALLLDTQRYVQRHPPKQDRNMLQLLRVVKSRGLDSARLLAPRDDVPTLHYYFPRADITGYRDPSDLPGGRFDAIVRMTDRVRIDAL
jgi:hypothetical protein